MILLKKYLFHSFTNGHQRDKLRLLALVVLCELENKEPPGESKRQDSQPKVQDSVSGEAPKVRESVSGEAPKVRQSVSGEASARKVQESVNGEASDQKCQMDLTGNEESIRHEENVVTSVLLQVDFSERFRQTTQHQLTGQQFRSTEVFVACVSWWENAAQKIQTDTLILASDDIKHDAFWVKAAMEKILTTLRQQFPSLKRVFVFRTEARHTFD